MLWSMLCFINCIITEPGDANEIFLMTTNSKKIYEFFSLQRSIFKLKIFQVNFPLQKKVPTLIARTIRTLAFSPQVFFGEMLVQSYNCCCTTLEEISKNFKAVESIFSSSTIFSHIISIYKKGS